jgi:hypothetical protein
MRRALLFIALLLPMAAMADVYKCTTGGKTVYSDVPCPAAKKVDINSKANTYTAEPISTYREQVAQSDSTDCADLSQQMERARPDTSTSVGERAAAAKNYKALRSQYEAQCLSSEQRNAASQERMERQMNRIERQQRQQNIRQQEIQNRQRGYGY